jgi:transcriptional antiterminator RfaH
MKPEEVDEPHWYCLRTAPKHEHIAAQHLRQTSRLDVFCPRLKIRKATATGAKWFVEAMFPGYIFAKFPFAERHREVRYSPSVTAILAFGGLYARISEEVIRGLKQCTNGEELIEVKSNLEQGETVRIISGALSGLEAVVTQVLPAKERVRILLNFLGQEIQAEVAAPDVIAETTHPLKRTD